MWQALETYHAVVYYDPDAKATFEEIGLKGYWMGYFASRSAPLGRVPPEVVVATFYNFAPRMVERALPDAWNLSSPEAVLKARYRLADKALRRVLDDPERDTKEAADLARALMAHCEVAGRPLFAAHRALAWPEEAHLVLWHAATLWREYRGDAHVAALVANGIDGCEAHVLAAPAGVVPERQRELRGWSEDEWADAAESLRERGLLDPDGRLTSDGRALRERVDDLTDELSLRPIEAAGEETSLRLIALLEPVCEAISDAGALPYPNAVGLTRLQPVEP